MTNRETPSTHSAFSTGISSALGGVAGPAGDVDVEERTTPVTTDGGDHERFAHYVKKREILPSSIEGTPLEALCGKKWVPSRDPERFPICPECKEIYESLKP